MFSIFTDGADVDGTFVGYPIGDAATGGKVIALESGNSILEFSRLGSDTGNLRDQAAFQRIKSEFSQPLIETVTYILSEKGLLKGFESYCKNISIAYEVIPKINGEEITIMEALGLASDLTIKGQRNNILVIRDFDGTKVYYRIDLTTKEATKSPVYYLTQNDVVYVEPNQSAVTASSLDNRATIAISIASILITSTVIILTRN